MGELGLEALQRPLTQQERDLIVWLIEHGTYADKAELHAQVARLTVSERCTCGCPTIYFALDGNSVPNKGERLVSDHVATVEGMEVGVMLFETDGRIGSLEVCSCGGADRPFGLPEISAIRTIE